MPISSLHPQYAERFTELVDCRTAFEGSRSVKRAAERYLPRLRGQTQQEYEAYKGRATFFGITAKTIGALVGMAMMRDPIVSHSDEFDPYFKEKQGFQFLELCSTTIAEVLLMGGYGLFIDSEVTGGEPKVYRYAREKIINWIVNPDTDQTEMVMLEETVYARKGKDRYESEASIQYRELWLDNEGIYHASRYDSEERHQETYTPTVRGQTLRFIPFYLINPLGVSMEMIRPPVIDIVDLNFSHYRTSADLEHGRHFTGIPTPVISGVDAGQEIYIGSEKAMILPDKDAKASFLEFTGSGLGSLERAMVEKQGQMASMSARLIDNSKRGSEAAETVKLRYMSESASLITVVRACENGFNVAYSTIAEFIDAPAPDIKLNKEFMDIKMSPTELTALVNAYIEGTIGKQELLYNLRKGDIVPPTRTDEEVLATIKDPPPQPTPGQALPNQRQRASQGA